MILASANPLKPFRIRHAFADPISILYSSYTRRVHQRGFQRKRI